MIKEELIEREETSRWSRKVGDGRVSSESTEEIERIVIEDNVEGESYMIRTVGQEKEDAPVPHRNVLTQSWSQHRWKFMRKKGGS